MVESVPNSFIKNRVHKIARGLIPGRSFTHNVLALMTGTVLGQGLIILASPLLTRLYTPDDFGDLGLFVAMSGFLSALVSWRYQRAIMLPQEESEAFSLLVLSFLLAFVMTGICVAALLTFRLQISELFGSPALAYLLWLLPVMVVAQGIHIILGAWFTRQRMFKRIATARASRSGLSVGVQIVASTLSVAGPWGLVLGVTAGRILEAGLLSWRGPLVRGSWKLVDKGRLLSVLTRYKKFALFSTPAALFGEGAQYLPLLLLGYFFGPANLGFYFLARRIVGLPATFISESISGVFYQRLAEEKRKTGTILVLQFKAFAVLFFVGLGGVIILAPLLPYLFFRVFGPEWSEAGHFSQLLLPIVFARFVTSPISQSLSLYEKQEVGMYWQVLDMLGSGAIIILTAQVTENVSSVILTYSIFGALMQILRFILCIRCAGGHISHIPYYLTGRVGPNNGEGP